MLRRPSMALRSMMTALAIAGVPLLLSACATTESSTSTPAQDSPPGPITIREPDGGSDFYARFTDGFPTSPVFLPIGVWSESVVDDTGWPTDKAAGLNTYVSPTPDSDLAIIGRAGMHSLPSLAVPGPSVVGYTTSDEVDMWAGPGDSPWAGGLPGAGPICEIDGTSCGYSVMTQFVSAFPPASMLYTNYGKGITFWETDDQARRFVNDFQDVVSADNYWFTDPYICGHSEAGALFGTGEAVPEDRCRLAANYGATVQRVRSLVEPAGSKPVWNFVEVGQPFVDSPRAISGPQIRAAAWSGLINGARGIVYFNHSFGGSCQSQHVLRDCDPQITAAVTALNKQITRLAPVLNAPSADNFVDAGDQVDAAAKLVDGEFYILAGSKVNAAQDATFNLACGGADSAVVVDEDREIPIVDGTFTDHFDDGNAVHIYRLTGGDACGLG